jgi:hypothetical protein
VFERSGSARANRRIVDRKMKGCGWGLSLGMSENEVDMGSKTRYQTKE